MQLMLFRNNYLQMRKLETVIYKVSVLRIVLRVMSSAVEYVIILPVSALHLSGTCNLSGTDVY